MKWWKPCTWRKTEPLSPEAQRIVSEAILKLSVSTERLRKAVEANTPKPK